MHTSAQPAVMHLRLGATGLASSSTPFVHFISLIMFNFKTRFRTSTCIDSITVNPVRGRCVVDYKSTGKYEYKNVSRLALLNLLFNDQMSYGFWVNHNLLCCDSSAVVDRQLGYFFEPAV